MTQQYLQIKPWWEAVQNALKPKLLLTMSLSILGAVVIFGLFCINGEYDSFFAILTYFMGVIGSLLWFLFGLTALAYQLYQGMQSEPIPNTVEAFRFAWSKARTLIALPTWGVAILLALLLFEMLLLALANIPGLGLVWLSLLAVPLLLLNTIVAVALVLALFNIAARVVLAGDDVEHLKTELWMLIKQRLPMLLIYNLGGVLATCVAAVVLLSPLWLGAQVTLGLMDYTANDALLRVLDSVGFWGSIAHLVALVMLGLLLAAIASVPGVVITHLTLLVHQELMLETDVEHANDAEVEQESETEKATESEHDKGEASAE